MSPLRALMNLGMARRVGIWALIRALPDEDALRDYLKMAYMGLAGVIVGSVLTGAALSVGLVAVYRLLLEAGWTQPYALGTTVACTLLLIVGCFTLAGRWFVQLAAIKNEAALWGEDTTRSVAGFVGDAVHAVTDGFIAGLTSRTPQAPQPAPRRIRLINE